MQHTYPGIQYDWTYLFSIRPGRRGIAPEGHPWHKVAREFRLRCFTCGQAFRRPRGYVAVAQDIGTSGRMFCGHSCGAKWRTANGVSGRKKRDLHRYCAQCLQKFSRPSTGQLLGSQAGGLQIDRKHEDATFCTVKCRAIYMSANELVEHRTDRIRKALKTAAANGKVGHCGIPMRSGWEVEVARKLDEAGVSWEYEPVTLSTPLGTYTPDFRLADGSFIEVKGFRRGLQDEKRAWLERAGYVFRVVGNPVDFDFS